MVRKLVDGSETEKDDVAVVSDEAFVKDEKSKPVVDAAVGASSTTAAGGVDRPSLESRFRHLFGFSWVDFRSWKALSTMMHAPRDPASLGIFRMLFGIAMTIDVFSERHLADLGHQWNNERICVFSLFEFLEPLPLAWMFLIHVIMGLGALCIALGLFFRYTIWMHIIPYWYVFMLDKTTWNNHTYLFGLVSLMLAFTSANHAYSLDAVINPNLKNKQVPAWNYAIFKYQFLIVYFIAGLKKCSDMDWMMGWSMGKLSKHWVFAPFTALISEELVNFFIVHLGGATLDLTGGWLLFFDKTRPLGIFLVQQFHIMNMQMFSIGMFPYVMLCTTPMFCYPDWPRRLWFNMTKLGRLVFKLLKRTKEQSALPASAAAEYEIPEEVLNENCIYPKEMVKREEKEDEREEKEEEEEERDEGEEREDEVEIEGEEGESEDREKEEKSSADIDALGKGDADADAPLRTTKESTEDSKKTASSTKSSKKTPSTPPPVLRSSPTRHHNVVSAIVLAWMAWQAFLPYSHFVTKGYNGWTEGLYGYSWDMMIKTWQTQHVRVSFKDMNTGEEGYLNPDAISEGSGNRWSSHPDMVKQFTKCVQKKFLEFNVTDFQLHFDVWRSMTKRFQQRMFDPRVDLVSAYWSPFASPSWVLPLLSDLSDWRERLQEITKTTRDESEDGEELMPNIIFAADFPGLYLENYVNDGLDNTTIELLKGEIEIEFLGLDGDEEEEKEEEDDEEDDEAAKPKEPHELSEFAKKGENVTLNVPGQRIKVPDGEYHRVHTIGSDPSCYMYVYENMTDKAEFKKEMENRKMWQKMVNASRDEPGKYNFTDAIFLATFLPEATPEIVTQFVENWQKKNESEEAQKSEIVGTKYFRPLMARIAKTVTKYSKAGYMTSVALKSIWQGRPMEDLLKERQEELKAMVAEEEAAKNNSTDTSNPTTTTTTTTKTHFDMDDAAAAAVDEVTAEHQMAYDSNSRQ